jgi:type I restriction-modification system DNA methylase subunit
MINKENFNIVLERLGFNLNKQNEVYSKKYTNGAVLIADFKNEKLIYPKEITKGSKTTTNFSQNENFVVFECVNNLLQKEYNPENIELEQVYGKLKKEDGGGRADIIVKDNDNKVLLIIECKIYGKEFDHHWQKTLFDGDQLFRYLTNKRETQYLCLYSSGFIDDKVMSKYHLISLNDSKQFLEDNKEKELLSFEEAKKKNKEDIYKAWAETYMLDYSTKGIFENGVPKGEIGKTRYSIEDLSTVSSKDIQGKYHEFAKILRQHNVSGRENAFDKLVNLFLCKVVDETINKDELKFYWKGNAFDNPYDLQDRLQKLYKEGMEIHLKDDITYIGNKDIEDAFSDFKGNPSSTEKAIKEFFKKLKFYTNNDFAFIDVHNKDLFYQNFEVLLKIIKIFQDIRLTEGEEDQFLGDMFEGFLDNGVKQSEGQFFTPMPIVKFIVNSLPEMKEPQVIDYACGAGHFLNEYALKNPKSTITGIEKEYRLSKVTKVSSFMYNHEMHLHHFDALATNRDIKDSFFDVLVANPPYSVTGFLETLKNIDINKYELADKDIINKKTYITNNSIECFFIERAKQLLKPDAVAGIILPISILTKDTPKIYISTREIILKYFEIVAITKLESNTFGKTPTTTATLFLRRRKENPNLADHYKNMVDVWFNGDFETNEKFFKSSYLLSKYCESQGNDVDYFKDLLLNKLNTKIFEKEVFEEYKEDYDKSSKLTKQQETSQFKKLPILEQEKVNQKRIKELISYIKNIEKDKLYYFCLAYNNPEIIIVTAPSNNSENKKFLGYDWSSARGNEGIQYIASIKTIIDDETIDEDDKRVLENLQSLSNIETPLYNPKDLNDGNKINTIIKANFNGGSVIIPEELKKFVKKSSLIDTIDFNSRKFIKKIDLSADKKIAFDGKYSLEKLYKISELIRGVTYSKEDQIRDISDKVILTADNITLQGAFVIAKEVYLRNDYSIDEIKKLKNEDIFICLSSGSKAHLGKVAYIANDTNYYAGGFMGIIRVNKKVISKFLFELLNSAFYKDAFSNYASGSNINNLSGAIDNLKIPVPPLNIQNVIIAECGVIDISVEKAKNDIANAKNSIESAIKSIEGTLVKLKSIAITNPLKREISEIGNDTVVSFIEMASVSNDGYIENKVDRPLKELKNGSYTYFKENDILIAKITPSMENGKCAIAKGLSNNLGMGSSEFHVIRVSNKMDSKYIFTLINREIIRQEAQKKMTGSSGHKRVPIKFYEDLQIPLLNENEQNVFVKKVEKFEKVIFDANKIINNSTTLKQEILNRYLK